ncbi:prepilin-type N-terminal cleavage/methylation domain-containing protein [Chromobacterium haemolyticum]|uniref:Prepilin-type N-terminal cleavage/methylation domain-containing protein n=1 Tax=Chromobacterium fluminis TaxID=3044269 RepID=A0ABX0LAZ9_9NEIS|nr:prepilin-type N-terminal cleavage/methylation domain-containing protein [Chromobacterium haemolyticum]
MQFKTDAHPSNNKSIKRQDGFTLLELMVGVAIIAVIGAIVAPFMNSTKSKATAMLSSMDSLGHGASLLNQEGGCYPTVLRALNTQGDASNSLCGIDMASNWRGPYARGVTFNAAGAAMLDTVATGITATLVRDTTIGVKYGIRASNVPEEILREADSQCNKSAGSTVCTTNLGTGGAPGSITKWFDAHS